MYTVPLYMALIIKNKLNIYIYIFILNIILAGLKTLFLKKLD
jgi:hypothetical protein